MRVRQSKETTNYSPKSYCKVTRYKMLGISEWKREILGTLREIVRTVTYRKIRKVPKST